MDTGTEVKQYHTLCAMQYACWHVIKVKLFPPDYYVNCTTKNN